MTAARAQLDRFLDTRRPYTLLLVLCLVLWLPGFFVLPPSDRDEARFVQATKQMLETGDFVTLRTGEVERNKKPIGIHWAQAPFAAAARAAGIATENPVWPYRIPSLLGGLFACWATFGLGVALVGRRAALLAAGLLAASVLLTVEAHIAKTDAALLAAVTATMGLLARAWLDPDRFGARHAALFWLALGAGVLLKGPVAPMIPALAALWLWWRTRRARWLLALRPSWGIPLMLAVVLPWFVAVGIATDGRFFVEAVGQDFGGKIASGGEQHWGPPGMYLLLLPFTLFPASLIVLRALPAAWRARAEPAAAFLIAWVVPNWIVFEAVATKLPHYVLPLYPALCLWGARWALDPARDAAPRWWARGSVPLFLAGAAVLGIAGLLVPLLADGRPGWGVAAPVAAVALAWVVLRALRGADWPRVAITAVVAMPLVYVVIFQFVLPRTEAIWISPRLTAEVRTVLGDRPPDDDRFGAVGYHEPSLMFLAGTGTRWIGTGWDGARFLAEAPGRLVAIGDRDLTAFHEEAAKLGITPREVAEVDGFNYSRGRRTVLTLFVR